MGFDLIVAVTVVAAAAAVVDVVVTDNRFPALME